MRILVLLILCLFAVTATAEEFPIHFTVSSRKTEEKKYLLHIQGNAAPNWYIYTQDDSANELEGIRLQVENATLLRDEPLLAGAVPRTIRDIIFQKQVQVYEHEFTLLQMIHISGTVPAVLKVRMKGFASNGEAFLPFDLVQEVELEGGVGKQHPLQLGSVDLQNPVSPCGEPDSGKKSLLFLFLLGFGGGLLALLTPCIFPMIPVTVSYFTSPPTPLLKERGGKKKGGVRNAVLYGVSIFLIYVLASAPFHLMGNINPQIFNIISTNAWVNVFFFVVFILFALSFFGLFDIKLPAFLSNTAGSKSGIFFLALTLVIVSFSCTGIILGSLLVNALSQNGSAWELTAGMGGFGAALGIPFALFALFPQWMKRLPKSGGWMATVKHVLAFVELALAIKFLSNADLVEHWGFLKREVFTGLWFVIALSLSIYLFKIVPRLRTGVWELTGTRFTFAVLSLAFSVYLLSSLLPGSKNQLRLLSGFPPPASYSFRGTTSLQHEGPVPDYINDYEKAFAAAKLNGKPLLIDFTGWACVNCRKMEELVWAQPAVKDLIQEKYVLLSLYVDDRKLLPPEERFTYTTADGAQRDIVTIGDKWAAFQTENFKQVTQPMYVIIGTDGRLMNSPVGYTPDADEYKSWLECGWEAHKN